MRFQMRLFVEKSSFALGVRFYEGLYSGNDVIIPGNEQDIERLPNIEKCKENIYFYEPRNVESFVEALKKAEKKKRDVEFTYQMWKSIQIKF